MPLLAMPLAMPPAPMLRAGGEVRMVARITDGDTFVLQGGQRVRLVQIDAPEVGGGECFSRAAKRRLTALVPPGSTVRLERDPALDGVDRYGRLLRYVTRNGVNVNLRLVANGSAAPYFYRGDRGRWSDALLTSARRAKRLRLASGTPVRAPASTPTAPSRRARARRRRGRSRHHRAAAPAIRTTRAPASRSSRTTSIAQTSTARCAWWATTSTASTATGTATAASPTDEGVGGSRDGMEEDGRLPVYRS